MIQHFDGQEIILGQHESFTFTVGKEVEDLCQAFMDQLPEEPVSYGKKSPEQQLQQIRQKYTRVINS